jgi:hypothetical protein
MGLMLFHSGIACLAILLSAVEPMGYFEPVSSAQAEATRSPPRARAPARSQIRTAVQRPASTLGAPAPAVNAVSIAPDPYPTDELRELAKRPGEPQIPGLNIIYLHPLQDPAQATWQNIIVHQTEGPPGSAKSMAGAQAKNPTKRGVTVWVETDGTVYWSTAETAIPTHGDGANRNDNKYLNNIDTYRRVIASNSIGVEFVGNFPDVAKPATPEQIQAWLILVRFLQERYRIPTERIYAHNWIDFKDHRYCEGCELATLARKLGYEPGRDP